MIQRSWDGKEWEVFAKKLVQLRHGPTNVQSVPDNVSGDCGLEYFTTDGCLYQSYAPVEVSDVAKAASAMKKKASRDLGKLIRYESQISKILGTIKAQRWILLCPFLDNKDVVRFIQKKTVDLKLAELEFVEPSFHALVHSQDDFSSELEKLKQDSLGVPLTIVVPTHEDVSKKANLIDERLQNKLKKAFPNENPEQINVRKLKHIKAFLKRETTLEQLRDSFPDLWERSWESLDAEEDFLGLIGPTGAPHEQLLNSLLRVEEQLKSDLPNLGNPAIKAISRGTLSDWLIRCPLDFV